MQSLAVYVGRYGDRVGVKNSRRQHGKGSSHVDSAAATVWPQAISPGEADAFCILQRVLPMADLLAMLQLKKSLNGLDLSPQATGPPRLWFQPRGLPNRMHASPPAPLPRGAEHRRIS
jgi:hypothetical protein